MRPPHYTGEDRVHACTCTRVPYASMRPPHYTGEDPHFAGVNRHPLLRFNEAPALHGGRLCPQFVVYFARPRFNEAPALHGGRRGGFDDHFHHFGGASMRPPHYTGEDFDDFIVT